MCRNKKLFCRKNFSTTLTANFQTKKVLQLLSITLLLHHRSNARVTKKTFLGYYNARCNCGKGKGNNGASVYRRKRLPACVYVKNTLTKHCSCTPVVRSDTTLPSANTNNCKNICNNRHCVNLLLHDSKNWQVRAILCLRQTKKKAENPPFFVQISAFYSACSCAFDVVLLHAEEQRDDGYCNTYAACRKRRENVVVGMSAVHHLIQAHRNGVQVCVGFAKDNSCKDEVHPRSHESHQGSIWRACL